MKNDIVWLRFNYLLVLKEVERIWYNRYFLCKCDCWNQKNILLCNITSWRNSSCWCRLKIRKSIDIKLLKIKRVWYWLRQRTDNPKCTWYKYWGGRWIKCEWNSFKEFYADMWEKYQEWLSLDRINNDWNYCKDNCRWATRSEQNSNTRKNILVDWICIKQYCKLHNLNYWAINMRLHMWWTIEKSISTPIKKFKKRNYKE